MISTVDRDGRHPHKTQSRDRTDTRPHCGPARYPGHTYRSRIDRPQAGDQALPRRPAVEGRLTSMTSASMKRPHRDRPEWPYPHHHRQATGHVRRSVRRLPFQRPVHTSARGGKLVLHEHYALQRQHSQRATVPTLRDQYHTHRLSVERSMAWLTRGNCGVLHPGITRNNVGHPVSDRQSEAGTPARPRSSRERRMMGAGGEPALVTGPFHLSMTPRYDAK